MGISDDGNPVGIETDGFANEDKMGLHLVNIIKSRMGIQAITSLHAHFDDHEDCRVMVVKCKKSSFASLCKRRRYGKVLYPYRPIHKRT